MSSSYKKSFKSVSHSWTTFTKHRYFPLLCFAAGAAFTLIVLQLFALRDTTPDQTFAANKLAIEAENGKLEGSSAKVVSDAGASNGKYVQLGKDAAPTSTPTPTPTVTKGPTLTVTPTLAQTAKPPLDGSWKLAFSDEFDGAKVDTSKWSFTSNAEAECDKEGCANPKNQQLEYNWGKNCTLSGGILTITAKREKHGKSEWTSCMLHSKPQFQQMYMETRAKFPAQKGFWPGFWTWNSPKDEVDVFEYYSDNKKKLYMTDHTSGGKGCTINLSFDPTTDYHTYAADMTPSKTVFYIDGKKACESPSGPDQKVSILLDMFVYSKIPPAGTTNAETMHVDYIRAWQRQ